MTTAFRLKTFPEILANMFATAQALYGDTDIDLNVGSVFRTIFETAALSDADIYVQLARLLDLRNLDAAKGDDLDALARIYGSDIFTDLQRRSANTSISKIVVGDGALQADTIFALDAFIGDSTFTVLDGSGFPTSGAVTIDRGTAQSEDVIYTRVGNVFTVLHPLTGLATSHQVSSPVILISTRSILAAAVVIASVTLLMSPGTGAAWPVSGSVILDRATVFEETLAFTRVGDTLTVPPTVFAHNIDSVVILSTYGSARVVAAGLTPFVPPTEFTAQIDFRVTLGGVLLDGDLSSDPVDVESVNVGADTRVGSNTITRWLAIPFTNATVTNPIAATRGADRESDENYRQRIKDSIQSLTRATPLSIETAVSGLVDPVTGQAVAFAQIVEPVSPGTSYIYITDGTSTFSLTQVPFIGRDVIIRDAEAGDQRGHLGQYGPFSTPRLFTSVERGTATSVGLNFLEDTTQAMVVNAYTGMYLKTDDDQFRLIASNTAIQFVLTAGDIPSLGSYSVFDFAGAPLVYPTDFAFNESTGDLELVTPLLIHDGLVAASDGAPPSVGAYLYTTGLGAYVQRVINGDPTDFTDFPGLRATGTKIVVLVPSVISPTLIIKVIASRGFTDAQIEPSVATAVQNYINSLGIGDNIIISEIIRVVKELAGVDDVSMVTPTANVTIPSNQIARVTSANVDIV
jgi:uncharacterized phage protein gp47/JayE